MLLVWNYYVDQGAFICFPGHQLSCASVFFFFFATEINRFQTTITAMRLGMGLISSGNDLEPCAFSIINFLFFSHNPWFDIPCLVA